MRIRSLRFVCRQCSLLRTLFYFTLLYLTANECLVYWIQSLRWPSLPPHSGEEEIRVLFVADPQIQGYRDEHPILGYITRWDADWYLQKTYSLARHHVKPDVVVFLGDLVDEGSIASDAEYTIYHQRFRNIFHSHYEKPQEIFVAGDNDIGGEGFDPITDKKVGRFEWLFGNTKGVVSTKFVDFIKLGYNLISQIDKVKEAELAQLGSNSKSDLRILINHKGVTRGNAMQLLQTLHRALKPSLIVTGDTHRATVLECQNCRSDKPQYTWQGDYNFLDSYKVLRLDLKQDKLYEIVVPSCSYRMGVPSMGYGAAVLNKHGEMRYTVLWLPARYTQLYCYIPLLVIVGFFLLVNITSVSIKKCAKKRHDGSW